MTAGGIAVPPWVQLQALVRESAVDGIVLSSYEAVTYFGGVHLLSQMVLSDRPAFLLVTSDDAVLVVCNIEAGQARFQSPALDAAEYVEFQEPPERVLARELASRGLGEATIGAEARSLPMGSRDRLLDALPRLTVVGLDDEVEVLQATKSQAARGRLAAAANSTLAAITRGVVGLGERPAEVDVASAVVGELVRAGGAPVFCFFGSGERALLGHPEASSALLTAGDVWRMDVGGRFEHGIMSDVARTGVVGVPTGDQQRAFDAVRAAQQAGLEALRPGNPASDVFRAVRNAITAAGYEWNIPHAGHGLGVGVHEQPIFAPTNARILEPGMVVCIEPILLLVDRAEAYHVEDLAVVGDDVGEWLTTPHDDLLRIPT